ncbi:MAG: hypothetical protein HYR84_08280, partial [Planctomycetes bacterium]|nr:hypothetical protein [Planctomycetota bacterium]
MAHQSDNSKKLRVRTIDLSKLSDLPSPNPLRQEVFLFILPFGRSVSDAGDSKNWFERLQDFARGLNDQSVVAVLTTSQDAAETWPCLSTILKLQLWVAVKLQTPIENENGQLAEHHAAMLIMSKYHSSLKHTKTRIAYTFCPACDKTTKDYGGKKHTYHEYGTLMSDVWREIAYVPGKFPEEIANRLADLFGLPAYQEICVFDLRSVRVLQSHATELPSGAKRQNPVQVYLPSALINGDSLAELRQIPENAVDFCFADPPYNLDKR